jgi:hypothetical protein
MDRINNYGNLWGTQNLNAIQEKILLYFPAYEMHRPIRRTLIFSLEILEKIMMNVF